MCGTTSELFCQSIVQSVLDYCSVFWVEVVGEGQSAAQSVRSRVHVTTDSLHLPVLCCRFYNDIKQGIAERVISCG